MVAQNKSEKLHSLNTAML